MDKNKRKAISEWSGAEYAPDELKWAEERGIKVKDTPFIIQKALDLVDYISGAKQGHGQSNRPFVFGNTIYTPDDYGVFENTTDIEKSKEAWYNYVVKEEAPHVAQWREEGKVGFIVNHILDLLEHGAHGKTYGQLDTHESYHFHDPDERKRLMSLLEPEQDVTEVPETRGEPL